MIIVIIDLNWVIMSTQLKTPQELQADLGEGMRALRIAQKMTQKDLALKAEVSPKAVAQLERAEGSSVETLIRALRALRATDFIGNMAPQPEVSPLALLHSPRPLQRVRRRRPAPSA